MLAREINVVSVLYFFWDWEKRAAGNKGAYVQVCCRKITGVLYCLNTISLTLVSCYIISVKILKEKCKHYYLKLDSLEKRTEE